MAPRRIERFEAESGELALRFGVDVANFGDYADPGTLAELAVEAEESGWDGFFVFDHILPNASGTPLFDPWVALGAIATATTRIRIGPMVTPVPRRRPWKLARETVSIDHLSGGRLTLGVGLGGPAEREFETFGEPTDPGVRASMLDEGLDVLAGLWSGRRFSFSGRHYRLKDVAFSPVPVQSPRIPIWVGAKWRNKAPLRRAACWEGVFPIPHDGERIQPDDLREVVAYIEHHRGSLDGYDVVVADHDGDRSHASVKAYADAGLTWWVQRVHEPWASSLREARALIRAGPPGL